MKTQKFKIVNLESYIEWTGRKVTGAHNGTIALKNGTLTFNDNQLTGGQFTIDTTAIVILDVTDPATNAQFAGHLASDDFFASEKFPEAMFEIIAVKDNRIEGNLTIKKITHPISFDAAISIHDDTVQASGKIVVDRTKY